MAVAVFLPKLLESEIENNLSLKQIFKRLHRVTPNYTNFLIFLWLGSVHSTAFLAQQRL
jgi:quinol-cytochrome oxidoreductase complex cytochrome b subunit